MRSRTARYLTAAPGLFGTPLIDLPAWIVPQSGAKTTYLVPSYGQKQILDTFAPLGLTDKVFAFRPTGDRRSRMRYRPVTFWDKTPFANSSISPPRVKAPTIRG